MSLVIQAIGVASILLALLDAYLTVLYARAGTAILSERLSRWTFLAFRGVAGRAPERLRGAILAFSGPTILVLIVVAWFTLLTVGFALIAWPHLSSSFVGLDGRPGQADFVTAVAFSGSTFTTATSGEPRPTAAFFKVLSVIEAAIGMSVITLTLTYFLQIYSALQRRNVLALGVQHASDDCGDAAALLAGLGPGGDFAEARSELNRLGEDLRAFYESHHFYPSLLYFRFQEMHHTPGGITLTLLDAVTLIDCALDDGRYGTLKRSGAVLQLRRTGMHLLKELSKPYLLRGSAASELEHFELSAEAEAAWRRRFAAALGRLRAAGIPTVADEAKAADAYVAARREWGPYIDAFLDHLGRD